MRREDDLNSAATSFLASFPNSELYRLFVDGTLQRKGWRAFENNEPGYLRGMMYAFYTELAHLDEPLTADVILRIHENCLKGVRETNYDAYEEDATARFREGEEVAEFGLAYGENLSHDGLDELGAHAELTKNKVSSRIKEVDLGEKGKINTVRFSLAANSLNTEKDVAGFLKNYHKEMKQADSDPANAMENKIAAIVKLTSLLERNHGFNDANCRTFCMILLNRELMKVGLYPPILLDPNEFDGLSQFELINRVKEGIARTTHIIEHGSIAGAPEFSYRRLIRRSDLAAAQTEFKEQNRREGSKNEVINYILAEKSDQIKHPLMITDPEVVKNYAAVEIPYVGFFFVPEQERIALDNDSVLYHMIHAEAIDMLDPVVSARLPIETEVPARGEDSSITYQAMLEALGTNLINKDKASWLRLEAAIQYGCANEVSRLFEVTHELIKQDASQSDLYKLYATELHAWTLAKRNNRLEAANIIANTFSNQMVELTNQDDEESRVLVSAFLKKAHEVNPELCSQVILRMNENGQLMKENLPPDVKQTMAVLGGQDLYKRMVAAHEAKQATGSFIVTMFKRFKSSGKPDEGTVNRYANAALAAFAEGKTNSLERLSQRLFREAAVDRKSGEINFYHLVSDLNRQMTPRSKQTKPHMKTSTPGA